MPVDVHLPEHLTEPLVYRRPWWRPRLERPDGTALPTDRWGNRLADGVGGRPVRVEPDVQWSQLVYAVRVDDERVPLAPPLPRYAQVALLGFAVLAVVTGGLLGALICPPAAWYAAGLLRRPGASLPVRHAQALGVLVGAVLLLVVTAAGLRALLGPG